jgi:hypothetical protein
MRSKANKNKDSKKRGRNVEEEEEEEEKKRIVDSNLLCLQKKAN